MDGMLNQPTFNKLRSYLAGLFAKMEKPLIHDGIEGFFQRLRWWSQGGSNS
jgi:hypothetical protein